MTDDEPVRGAFVHDLRHRYSIELRPSGSLDARLRGIAAELEAAELLLAGASTAPRFHPHLTLSRSACVDEPLVQRVATVARAQQAGVVTFDAAATFGAGRIVYLRMADDELAYATRAAIVDQLAPTDLDPVMSTRAWTPHVTIAYAVPAHARDAALAHVRAQLPITGRFDTVEAWDLDQRPTLRVVSTRI